MSQPAEIETFPAWRIVAYGAAILFSSGETKRVKVEKKNVSFFPPPSVVSLNENKIVAQWKQNGRHSAKISMQFIAFIIKNAHQASLAEIVNFCNAFPCAGFFDCSLS